MIAMQSPLDMPDTPGLWMVSIVLGVIIVVIAAGVGVYMGIKQNRDTIPPRGTFAHKLPRRGPRIG